MTSNHVYLLIQSQSRIGFLHNLLLLSKTEKEKGGCYGRIWNTISNRDASHPGSRL